MKIVIDLQGAQSESRHRGIGRYSISLTKAILRHKGAHQIIVALNGMFPETIEPIRTALDGLIAQEDIRVWFAPGPVKACAENNHGNSQIAELIREDFMIGLQPEVVLITSMFDGFGDDAVTSIGRLSVKYKTVAILYDLIPLVQSEIYLESNPAYEKFYKTKLEYLKRADAWLTISDSSSREAVEHLQLDQNKITNISGACDPVFVNTEISDSVLKSLQKRFEIAGKFVLYSGGADARKNLNRLISVYSQLPKELVKEYQLVIAGKIPEANIQALRLHAKSCGVPDGRLVFTGGISDTDLCHLYNLCHIYVFPSLHEGFGLPVLEAMSCGAPVIASNTSSLPEVVGDADALFDPTSEQDILSKLTRVLTDKTFREKLIDQGAQNVKHYSWDACGKRALQALNNIETQQNVDDYADRQVRLVEAIAELKPNLTGDELMRCASMIALNQPRPGLKKLFVDISELVTKDAATGVQRVTRSILFQLIQNPPAGYLVEPVYGTTAEIGYRRANRFLEKYFNDDGMKMFSVADDVIESSPGDIFLGLDLQHQVTRYQLPYLNGLRSRGLAVYFVVYDLLPIQFPHFWPSGLGTVHADWLRILAKFDGSICISKAVANELIEWRTENVQKLSRPYKIGWFHLGADIDNSVPSVGVPENGLAVLAKLSTRPTFLSVGTIEPRKAHQITLDAFEILWSQGVDVNLVLVGKQGWLVDEFVSRLESHPEKERRLFWLKGVSDEYLAKIYESATCLITSSVGEGFGLPLIEAAQHSKPIIARDLPVFKEVAGDYATYFNGDGQALAVAVQSWLQANHSGRIPDISKMPWLTWEQSANQLKKVIFENNWMTQI
ncbi:glycosyltransferase family 4 protein [Zwartia panacis]|uniref:glycosyltransferase family 4 protein n=1 Tax=Zwartia panacis TaxID=2683345 RepID=UPI0025B529F8|nr:glycosyltransferase family 1 protein [Zwartia panacis]MDN4018053.1 glycosyltransferase family 1 protein [Zwartia panacis]